MSTSMRAVVTEQKGIPGNPVEKAVLAVVAVRDGWISRVKFSSGGYGKAVALPNIGDLSELITEEGYVGEFFEPASARRF